MVVHKICLRVVDDCQADLSSLHWIAAILGSERSYQVRNKLHNETKTQHNIALTISSSALILALPI